MRVPLTTALLLLAMQLCSQERSIDELRMRWRDGTLADTARCRAMEALIFDHYLRNRPDTAKQLARAFLVDARRMGSVHCQARATLLIAAAERLMSNYDMAITEYRSAQALCASTGDRPGIAKAYKGIAACLRERGSLDSSDVYLDSAVLALVGVKDPVLYANLEDDRGLSAYMRGDLEGALTHWTATLAMHEAGGEKNAMAAMLGKVGIVHQLRGDHSRAIDAYYRSLPIMEEVNDLQGVGATCGNLGWLHLEFGHYDLARTYFQRSLDVARQISDRKAIADALNNLGVVHGREQVPAQAIAEHEGALAIRRELNDRNGMATSLFNLAECHRDIGDLDRAQELYSESAALCEETSNQQGLANALAGSAAQFGDRGDHLKAIEHGQRALHIARTNEYLTIQRNVTLILFTSLKNLGRIPQALTMLEEHMAIKDSIASNEEQRELVEHELQSIYEKEMLADSLGHVAELLSVRDRQRFAETRATAMAGGTALLLLGGGAWFYTDRRRRRERFEREKASLETSALRSQMNPHFIFNALNSINAYVQQNDQESASTFLTKFARVMRSVLENSRHSEVPLQDDLETLRGYLELERKRTLQKFDFTITVDPDLDPDVVLVPPLVVQPFVENAIWHGMASKEGKGHIALSVKRSGRQLIWSIEDDGAGRNRAATRPPADLPIKKTSLGTSITRGRLDLVQKQHGGRAGFRYIDLPVGTRVEVEMPLLSAN